MDVLYLYLTLWGKVAFFPRRRPTGFGNDCIGCNIIKYFLSSYFNHSQKTEEITIQQIGSRWDNIKARKKYLTFLLREDMKSNKTRKDINWPKCSLATEVAVSAPEPPFIWAHLAAMTRPGMSLTTSCGLREKLLLCAICSLVCPKESGALTVTHWPCVFFYH